jgi:hypothetical protein
LIEPADGDHFADLIETERRGDLRAIRPRERQERLHDRFGVDVRNARPPLNRQSLADFR